MLWYPQTLVFILHDHVAVSPSERSKLHNVKDRVVEARRHLWRVSSPAPAQSRGSWSRLLRAVSSGALSTLKDGDSTSPPGNLCQHQTTIKKLSPLCFVLCPGHVPACSRHGLSLYGRYDTGNICLQAPQRCVAAAPVSHPVGKSTLEGRQWCILSPQWWRESRSFQCPKGWAAEPSNAVEMVSGFLLKFQIVGFSLIFRGKKFGQVYIGYVSECMSFMGNIQNYSYGTEVILES